MRSDRWHHCVKTRTPFCPERYKRLDDTVHYSRDAGDESSLRKGGVFKSAIPARMLYCQSPEFRLKCYPLARDPHEPHPNLHLVARFHIVDNFCRPRLFRTRSTQHRGERRLTLCCANQRRLSHLF